MEERSLLVFFAIPIISKPQMGGQRLTDLENVCMLAVDPFCSCGEEKVLYLLNPALGIKCHGK